MIWSWVLTIVGVASLFLAGSRPRVGWPLALLNQILWAVYSIVTDQWGFLAGAACYAVVFARNWRLAATSAASQQVRRVLPAERSEGVRGPRSNSSDQGARSKISLSLVPWRIRSNY